MILELPKSDMGEYRFLIKLKMVPSSRPVSFSPSFTIFALTWLSRRGLV